MVPEELEQRWEAAYRRYGEASKVADVTLAGDRHAALEMVAASAEVAVAWRAIEQSLQAMPWWISAAIGAAAQAFGFQARDWATRAESGDLSGWLGPTRRLSTRSRRTPYRRTDETG